MWLLHDNHISALTAGITNLFRSSPISRAGVASASSQARKPVGFTLKRRRASVSRSCWQCQAGASLCPYSFRGGFSGTERPGPLPAPRCHRPPPPRLASRREPAPRQDPARRTGRQCPLLAPPGTAIGRAAAAPRTSLQPFFFSPTCAREKRETKRNPRSGRGIRVQHCGNPHSGNWAVLQTHAAVVRTGEGLTGPWQEKSLRQANR